MRARVQKWGNSLALRIPKPLASDLGLGENSEVELAVVKESLVVTPATEAEYSLESMLESITPQNLHGEVETGGPAGREAW